MCGILGCAVSSESELSKRDLDCAISRLYTLSESRGKEASGIAVRTERGLWVHREAQAASALLRSDSYRRLLLEFLEATGPQPCASAPVLIGHARLTTSGLQGISTNNQPVRCGKCVGVHNGIVVNADDVWRHHPDLEHVYDVDSEVVFRLIDDAVDHGETLGRAIAVAFNEIQGAASIALVSTSLDQLALATNVGSLYVVDAPTRGFLFFASERFILRQLITSVKALARIRSLSVEQVSAGGGILMNLSTFDAKAFTFENSHSASDIQRPPRSIAPVDLHDTLIEESEKRIGLRRCTRCILPETFPHIEFDRDGVCNYCREHDPAVHYGADALAAAVEPYRRKSTQADCLVAFSGGRDSSYCLHYVKRVLGLNPIAYTYDWGMVNDLARRNQSRMTSALGVEQIIISADIKRKRQNIGKNVRAWLKNPVLGMVPLFMAGDKQFFYYANRLRKQTGIGLFIWAENQLERTNFKAGFCGIPSPNTKERIYRLSMLNKARILSYYVGQFLRNPGYINRSILDTLFAFLSYYLIKHDYLWFYDFIPWNEQEINRVLIEQYGWETDPETTTTWRIGDETAAFYNYIYYTIAGFSENDTFRSNQIREGLLTRDEALRQVETENQPRYGSIREYLDIIQVDFDEAMAAIYSAKRLF